MSSSLVITLAVIGGVAWLTFLGVSALRARGKEEVAPNLGQGRTDEELETRRLERVQQFAVILSAFMAVGLPLYYLGEEARQESFVDQFNEESVNRGEHLIEEFGCFDCHGAGGSGGGATYIEKRLGVATQWFAPSLDDVFYRYEADEVNFWITYGRPNTPMPAWGVVGGGAMNEQQVQDIVNYLATHQIPQQDALARIQPNVDGQLQRLSGAEAQVEARIAVEAQLVADILRAPALTEPVKEIAAEMREVFDAASTGVDTDGDGLSDIAETRLSELSQELVALFALPGIEPGTLDPANPETTGRPDLELVEEILATLISLESDYPILFGDIAAIEAALETSGDDQDGDGLTDEAEAAISTQIGLAISSVRPTSLGPNPIIFDPTNPESSGDNDRATAGRAVSAAESTALQTEVAATNQERLLDTARAGLTNLEQAAQEQKWVIDIEGVAGAAFGGDTDRASRAVGLFNANCARCHTSGWSAGVIFTQEAGAGGFGPALWEGRPNVQFLNEEDLIDFLTEGSIAQEPYGVNGIGSGRMPGFGKLLSADDIDLIATYLRSGNLTGRE
ncbi:MAG TPA: c-type cytochrome [Acidimicrobiia bacterium]|nr:c-type cytochrome [Acidimicrobiia bacterium]